MTTAAALSIDVQAAMHAALGNVWRLRILAMLARHGGTITVEGIKERLDHKIEQPTISHHLHTLRTAGLVELDRKEGQYNYYIVRPGALDALRDALGGAL